MLLIVFATLLAIGTIYDAFITIGRNRKHDKKETKNGTIPNGKGVINGGFDPKLDLVHTTKGTTEKGDLTVDLQQTHVDTLPVVSPHKENNVTKKESTTPLRGE